MTAKWRDEYPRYHFYRIYSRFRQVISMHIVGRRNVVETQNKRRKAGTTRHAFAHCVKCDDLVVECRLPTKRAFYDSLRNIRSPCRGQCSTNTTPTPEATHSTTTHPSRHTLTSASNTFDYGTNRFLNSNQLFTIFLWLFFKNGDVRNHW